MPNAVSRLGARTTIQFPNTLAGHSVFDIVVFSRGQTLVHSQQEYAAVPSAGAAQISRVPAGSLHHHLDRPRPGDDS